MRNERGQALIEFVLILPILIMLIFSIIDFGRIITTKNQLESKISNVVDRIDEEKTYDEIITEIEKLHPSIKVNLIYSDDNYVTVNLEEKIEIITPGLNLILSSPYKVTAERVVKYVK